MSSPAPESREQIADAIVRCIDARDPRKALALCQQLNRQHPDYAYGWYLASFLMQKIRHYGDAIRAVDQALKLSYLDKYQLHKIRCHFEASDLAGAVAAAAVIRDKSFVDPLLHSQLGSLLHLLGDNAHALVHYTAGDRAGPRAARSTISTAQPCSVTSATSPAPRQASTRRSPSSPKSSRPTTAAPTCARRPGSATTSRNCRRSSRARARLPGWSSCTTRSPRSSRTSATTRPHSRA